MLSIPVHSSRGAFFLPKVKNHNCHFSVPIWKTVWKCILSQILSIKKKNDHTSHTHREKEAPFKMMQKNCKKQKPQCCTCARFAELRCPPAQNNSAKCHNIGIMWQFFAPPLCQVIWALFQLAVPGKHGSKLLEPSFFKPFPRYQEQASIL
eukprot:EG_transcript_37458